jgi:hypothetical protein
MSRRNFLLGGGAAAALARSAAAQNAGRGGKPPRVTGGRIYIAAIDGRYPVLLQLTTDQGVSGVGEYGTGSGAAAAMVKELLQQFVLGRDPFAGEAIWSDMYDHTFWAKGGGSIIFAGMSAVEQALWDIKGKCLGVPVYEMLGGKMRDKVRVYAKGWAFRCTEPADFAREAERVVKDGYTALKFYPLATAEIRRPRTYPSCLSPRHRFRGGAEGGGERQSRAGLRWTGSGPDVGRERGTHDGSDHPAGAPVRTVQHHVPGGAGGPV